MGDHSKALLEELRSMDPLVEPEEWIGIAVRGCLSAKKSIYKAQMAVLKREQERRNVKLKEEK